MWNHLAQEKNQASEYVKKAIYCMNLNEYQNAVKYYKYAAKLGESNAQYELGNLYKNGMGVEKDMDYAYKLYLESAKNGNISAMLNLIECYKEGLGTEANESLVNSWMEAVYTTRSKRNHQSSRGQNTEYYQENLHFSECEYNGRIYYIGINQEDGQCLFSTDIIGQDVKKIYHIKSDIRFSYVHVNDTGIYIYNLSKEYCAVDGHVFQLELRNISFEGTLISKYKKKYKGNHGICGLYFYDNFLYYNHYVDNSRGLKSTLERIHIKDGFVQKLYDKANDITEIFVNENVVVFKATYNNNKEFIEYESWMKYDLAKYKAESISNPSLNPELLKTEPCLFDQFDDEYITKMKNFLDIEFFDLSKNIFWVRKNEIIGEGDESTSKTYLEPYDLTKKRKSLKGLLSIWEVPIMGGRRKYFDGENYYCATNSYSFKSYDKYGCLYLWSENNGGHGVCDNFKILGNNINLNLDGYGTKQYAITTDYQKELREVNF